MTKLNVVLPNVTQADLSPVEQRLYLAMHTAMGQEAMLMLVAQDADSTAQKEMIVSATRAMIALAVTAHQQSVERGLM